MRKNALKLPRLIFCSILVVWKIWYWIHLVPNRNQLHALVSTVKNHFLFWVVGEVSSIQERFYFLDLIIISEMPLKLTSNVNRADSIIFVAKIPAFYKFRGLYHIHKNMSLTLVSDVTRKSSVSLWRVETSKKNDKHFDPCRLDY